ncbi:MAG: hypothetical protein ACR2PT_10500 [Endozoicomonas sp.]
MSLEARVQLVESKQEALDNAFRENNKILEATHGVVSLILIDQREMKKDQFELKQQVGRLEQKVERLELKVDQLELMTRERFDQIEMLLRQYCTKS